MVAAVAVLATGGSARAINFSLDSIAAWGKFPRLCVNTYKWGDRFFNSYDSTYVVGSGKRWNVKFKADTWTDFYNFRFDPSFSRIDMYSDLCTSAGVHLTYMAVSVGYDMNVNKLLGIRSGARKKFNFQFNCSLFALEYYNISNDVGTNISRMGTRGKLHSHTIPFKGLNTGQWGLDVYYFFNHKHYSQAAPFSYSKIQVKDSGSLFVGFSYWEQKYDFDFASISDVLVKDDVSIPEDWNYRYSAKSQNYALKIGYGYNWVWRNWCLGLSESPLIGVRRGYVNEPEHWRTSFSFMNRFRLGAVYNYKRKWFYGIYTNYDLHVAYDNVHTLVSSNLSLEVTAGFRFDLWK